ncbi:uncharacterized protein [Ptychodera flava]|uniref:uncharacterized protein isoform X3 n=1 Tax=Ptychodera flava TaxID=63121 RepID=UPI00396A48CF
MARVTTHDIMASSVLYRISARHRERRKQMFDPNSVEKSDRPHTSHGAESRIHSSSADGTTNEKPRVKMYIKGRPLGRLRSAVSECATAPNSTFSTQEFLSSYSQHNEVNRHLSTEEFRNLERRIERERERRTNTETSGNNSRLDGKGQRDESSPVEMSRKNYFRPMGRNNYFSRDTSVPTSRMNGSNPDSLVAMGTLAISPSPRGGGSTCISYSGGSSGSQKDCFNTRLRSPPPRTKGKSVISSSMSPMAPDRSSKMAKYVDPIGGAPPCFTQRLAELSSLECETIRYERTRKLKRQSKQAKQD